jgi:hypothetical protein
LIMENYLRLIIIFTLIRLNLVDDLRLINVL